MSRARPVVPLVVLALVVALVPIGCRGLSGSVTLDLDKMERLEDLFSEKSVLENQLDRLFSRSVAPGTVESPVVVNEREERLAKLRVVVSEIGRIAGTSPRSRFIPTDEAPAEDVSNPSRE